jgi:ADP-heptose:LPS heptosyltransferase
LDERGRRAAARTIAKSNPNAEPVFIGNEWVSEMFRFLPGVRDVVINRLGPDAAR